MKNLLCWFVADNASPGSGFEDLLLMNLPISSASGGMSILSVSGVQQDAGASTYSKDHTSETLSYLLLAMKYLVGMIS